MGVSLTLSFTALIFQGELASEMGRGAGWILASLVLIGLITGLTSSFRGLAAGPQDAPAVILAAAAAGLVVEASDPMATLAAFTILTSAVTGAVLILLGRFRLGSHVRLVPFPVVAGFLGGTGVVLARAGIELLFTADGSLELGLRVIPGILVGLSIVILSRRRIAATAPVIIVALALGAYHVAAGLSGIEPAEGMARQLLLGPFPEGRLADLGVISELWSADWGAVAGQLPALLVMALLVPVALLLNTGALEHTFKQDLDVNRELMSTGAGLMAAAPFAGLPGYVFLSVTVIGRQIGGASRVPPIVCAVFAAAVLWVGGDILSLVPVTIPAGLLIAVGLDFILMWIWDVRHRVGRIEHAIILAIVATVAFLGFFPGVGLGIVAATVLFVVRYSRVPAVRVRATARDRRSHVQRGEREEAVLTDRGDRVTLFELQGFLFFGTAEQIVQSVTEVVAERPETTTVVIDFHRTTGMDSSAEASFERLARFAEEQDLEVVLCGASPEVCSNLRIPLAHPSVRYEADIDFALQSCEEALLAETGTVPPEPEFVWSEVPAVRLEAGSAIVTAGERGAGVFLLESGQAVVDSAGPDGGRSAVLLAGSVIGEISHLSGGPATATVLCETDCVVRHMTEAWLKDLAETDPARALAIGEFIARRLAEKLTAANRTIRALK